MRDIETHEINIHKRRPLISESDGVQSLRESWATEQWDLKLTGVRRRSIVRRKCVPIHSYLVETMVCSLGAKYSETCAIIGERSRGPVRLR